MLGDADIKHTQRYLNITDAEGRFEKRRKTTGRLANSKLRGHLQAPRRVSRPALRLALG